MILQIYQIHLKISANTGIVSIATNCRPSYRPKDTNSMTAPSTNSQRMLCFPDVNPPPPPPGGGGTDVGIGTHCQTAVRSGSNERQHLGGVGQLQTKRIIGALA